MGERTRYFATGGVGCLATFLVLATVAVVAGGTAYIDLGGAILLFCIGGLIGVVYLGVKRRGRAEARAELRREYHDSRGD